MKLSQFILSLVALLFATSAFAGNNLHLIDAIEETGFEIYRTGKPDRKDVREFCRLGIQEIMVFSGNAKKHELKYQDECPTLKVVYNVKQDSAFPLTDGFLEYFHEWVLDSQEQGKKIAFRCNCGCHRTGRIAAYYEMAFMGRSHKQAKKNLEKYDKMRWLRKVIPAIGNVRPQIKAIRDYIYDRPCSVKAKHCVQPGSWKDVPLKEDDYIDIPL